MNELLESLLSRNDFGNDLHAAFRAMNHVGLIQSGGYPNGTLPDEPVTFPDPRKILSHRHLFPERPIEGIYKYDGVIFNTGRVYLHSEKNQTKD